VADSRIMFISEQKAFSLRSHHTTLHSQVMSTKLPFESSIF